MHFRKIYKLVNNVFKIATQNAHILLKIEDCFYCKAYVVNYKLLKINMSSTRIFIYFITLYSNFIYNCSQFSRLIVLETLRNSVLYLSNS